MYKLLYSVFMIFAFDKSSIPIFEFERDKFVN